MDSRTTPQPFLDWLNTELKERDWKDSDATRRSGLSHTAIYEIRSGIRPGVKKCRALARLFGYPEEYVLRLAGHLPPEVPEHRRQEFEQVAAILASLPDGAIREEAMAAIRAIAASARERATVKEKEKEKAWSG